MTDPTLDDSWRSRARDRMNPLTVRALAELLMKSPDAVVIVETALPENAVFPVEDADELAAVTRVVTLESGELLLCSDEGD